MEKIPSSEQYATAVRLRDRRAAIGDRWLEKVRAELTGARGEGEPALRDELPRLLDALANTMTSASVGNEQEAFGIRADARVDWSRYTGEEVMREHTLLRSAVFELLEQEGPVAPAARDRILAFFDEAVRAASTRYAQTHEMHQSLEVQYLKLIERLVVKSGEDEHSELRLQGFVEIVLTELGADAAAVVLDAHGTTEIRLATSTGGTERLSAFHRAALALSAAATTAGEDTVQFIPMAALEAETRRGLAELGIQQLVLVRILNGALAQGALFLGFERPRRFSALEQHLLAVFGKRFALLLTGLELQRESKAALERARRESVLVEDERTKLEDERKRRDEIISAISHDLRNPLHVVKLGVEMIRSGPPPNSTDKLANQILRNINRSDQMIRDLLDAQSIRAETPLSLEMTNYAMRELVEEVISNLVPTHGDRFVVEATQQVRGFWSWEGMYRVIDNLLTNAAKYSEPASPITVRVSTENDRMLLCVHNYGRPIPLDERDRIFHPFERGKRVPGDQRRGWGIGLTLVRGIVDGHGGTVTVHSTLEDGTTFCVSNPMDSRPAAG